MYKINVILRRGVFRKKISLATAHSGHLLFFLADGSNRSHICVFILLWDAFIYYYITGRVEMITFI